MNHKSAFAAIALAAALAPAIASAQQEPATKPAQDNPFAEGALTGQIPVSACTSDGFTEEGAVVIALSASDIKKLGDGDLQAGSQKLDFPAIQSELAKAWKAFASEMASTDLTGTEPSEKVQKALTAHLKEFVEKETKATGVHFGVAGVALGAPAPGCKQ